MDEDDDYAAPTCDFLCERAETLRNIAHDLETVKGNDGRRILKAAADLLLKHMQPPSARVIALIPKSAEKPSEAAHDA